MIKCILFLWRYSPGRFAAAMALTILSGSSGIALLGLASMVLQGRLVSKEVILWSFVGLCILLPLCRFAAEILISRMAQQAVFDLQMRLPRKIAGAPLRFLEDHGIHRLLVVLTQDMQTFGFALLTVPTSCLNLTIFAGGLVYLGWLSRMVLVAALGFIVFCLAIYRFPASRSANSMRLARKRPMTSITTFAPSWEAPRNSSYTSGGAGLFSLKSSTRRHLRYVLTMSQVSRLPPRPAPGRRYQASF
jgi:putative ATP-binding cassette transporter